MQRKTFLALTTSGLLVTILGDGYAQEAPTRKQKRFTPQKPPEDVRTQVAYSLIEERPGVQVYSPRFNDIIAVVLGEAVEWVATPIQVKRVDRKRNEVRLYDKDDGLAPGAILDLVGEGNDAYVLVYGADRTLVLCVFDPVKDRFERFPLEGTARLPPSRAMQQSHQLVLGQETVAVVPELIDPRLNGVPPFFTFDRRARRLLNGSWPQERLASPDTLTIAFAAIMDSTLWLGTQVGVLGAPLPSYEVPASWPRSGPQVYVRCGAALPDGQLLLLTQESVWEKSPILLRLDPKTGQTSTVSWGSFTLGYTGVTPLLMPDGAGGLWQIGGMLPDDATLSTSRPSVHRLKSLSATNWEQVDWSDVNLNRPVPPGVPITLADEETLPTPVAAALVCYLRGIPMNQHFDQDRWLRQRFWRWRTPEPPAQVPPELLPGGILGLQSQGITDTKDPTKTWLGEQGGFVLVPKRELDPPSPFGPSQKQRIEALGAQHFPIAVSLTQTAISVNKLLRGRVALAVTEIPGRLLRLTKKGTVPLIPPDPRIENGFLYGGLVAGPSQTRFVRYKREGVGVLQRWDEKKQELSEPTISLGQASSFSLAGTKQGIWLWGISTETTQSLDFLAVAPDGSVGDTWETVTLALPTRARRLGFGATAVWFQSYLPTGESMIHAWDMEKRCWSSIKGWVMTPRISFQTVESPDGSSWLFLSGENHGLLRYDPTGPTLERVSTENTARKSPSLGMVIAATRDAVWVADIPGCWRYDRATQRWSKPEQAQKGFVLDSHSTDYPYYSIPDTDGSWWVGGNHTLWRFDPVRGTWQEQTQEVLPELGIVSPALVTDDTVWGVNQELVVRLDRKTGKSRTYGPESGVLLPRGSSGLSSYSLQGAGGSTWILVQSSLLYFDAKKDRFVPAEFPKESNLGPSRRFSAIVSDPWRPQGVIVLETGGSTCKLYRGKGGKFDPIPLPQPSNIGGYVHMAVLGHFVYIAAPGGLWRIDASGRWERILVGGYIGRFVRDTERADILWALGISSFQVGPDPIVRLGPG